MQPGSPSVSTPTTRPWDPVLPGTGRTGAVHRSFGGWASLRNDANDWEEHASEVEYLRDWVVARDEWFEAWLR